MTCHCGRPVIRCLMGEACIARGWLHAGSFRHRCPGRQRWAYPRPVMML